MSDLENTNNQEALDSQIQEEIIEQPEEIVNNETNDESKESNEFDPDTQKKVGKLLKAERERERRRVEAEWQARLQTAQTQQAPIAPQNMENHVYDAETGEYVDVATPVGQLLLRQQKVMQRKQQEMAHNESLTLGNKIREGYERFDEYDKNSKTFMAFGTDVMAEALKGVDDPSAVIDFLGSHPEELKRIAQLPPTRQLREVVAVDIKVNPQKRLITNASPPVEATRSTASPVTRWENMSDADLSDYWRKKINER